MTKIMPQEVEVWYIIPAIRKEFARLMVEKGLSQKEAAKKLNITEAAVSQYLKLKRAKDIVFNKKVLGEIKKSVDKILKKKDNLVLLRELQRICYIIKEDFSLCKIHRQFNKDLPKNCRACFK